MKLYQFSAKQYFLSWFPSYAFWVFIGTFVICGLIYLNNKLTEIVVITVFAISIVCALLVFANRARNHRKSLLRIDLPFVELCHYKADGYIVDMLVRYRKIETFRMTGFRMIRTCRKHIVLSTDCEQMISIQKAGHERIVHPPNSGSVRIPRFFESQSEIDEILQKGEC